MSDDAKDGFGADFFYGSAFNDYPTEALGVNQAIAGEAIELLRPTRSLDVGCASGLMVRELRKAGVEGFGVDVSGFALGQAPAEVRPHLREYDAQVDPLPFRDGEFDLVTCIDLMRYTHDDELLLREMGRVTATGGTLVFASFEPKPGPRRRASYWARRLGEGGFVVDTELTHRFWSGYWQRRMAATRPRLAWLATSPGWALALPLLRWRSYATARLILRKVAEERSSGELLH